MSAVSKLIMQPITSPAPNGLPYMPRMLWWTCEGSNIMPVCASCQPYPQPALVPVRVGVLVIAHGPVLVGTFIGPAQPVYLCNNKSKECRPKETSAYIPYMGVRW